MPKTSAGTKLPMKRPQSHAVRHAGSGSLLRYLNPTGRKNSANSTSSSAKYMPENAAAYTSGHAANVAPPAMTNHVWLPSQLGSIERRITRRSSSDRPRNGDSIPMPMSQPSVNANAMRMNPTSAHQMTFRVA